MQMGHTLIRVLATVGDNPKAVFQLHFLCQSRNNGKDMTYQSRILLVDLSGRGVVLFGNHQKVDGSHAGNIMKGVAEFILIDLFRGNFPRYNLTKQAIIHS